MISRSKSGAREVAGIKHPIRVMLFALTVCAGFAVDAALAAADTSARIWTRHVVSDGGSFYVTLSRNAPAIPLNEMFELNIDVRAASHVKDTNPIWVSVNASMPAHQHGMNTRPRVEELGKGRFVVRGMLFHMAGVWEIALDVAKGSVHEHAKTSLDLK